jgi:uncharacterized protein YtpQ (UPF0354 family)
MGFLDLFKSRKSVDEPPSDPRKLFANEVATALEHEWSDCAVQRDDQNFGLLVKHENRDWILNLENLFAETRELSPADRRDRIRRYVRLVEGPELDQLTWEEARSSLMPAVRGCSYGADAGADGPVMVRRPFLPFLDAAIVFDEPEAMRYLVRTQLDAWQTSEDEAFAAAMGNAARAAAGSMEPYSTTHGPVWHVPGEDAYAASRLLVPGWLASMSERVEGRPVAVIPERSILFVGGDARPELVRWLAEVGQREHEAGARGISPAVYTTDDRGVVVPYESGGAGAVAHLVHLGHTKLLGQAYEDQKALLDPLHARTGVDVYVASVGVVTHRSGPSLSWCTWGDGIESLLPKTDVVVVGGRSEGAENWTATLPFETARAIAGPLWTAGAVPFGPERVKASGAMSQEQKKAFLAASRPLGEWFARSCARA